MMRKKLLTIAMITIFCFVAVGFIGGCDTQYGTEKRDCVVMIGDSIFALSGQITRHLQDLSGQKYRTYYMVGAQMSGGANDIESQYDRASRQGDIRTIIMDGGGNDFFFGNQLNLDRIAEEIAAAWSRILQKAAADGVENIVVMGYYKTITTPNDDRLNGTSLGPDLEAAGQRLGINLVYVDPNDDPWFYNKRPGQYTRDTIHPTTAAANELAKLIWQAMQDNNIEQGANCSGWSPSDGGSSWTPSNDNGWDTW